MKNTFKLLQDEKVKFDQLASSNKIDMKKSNLFSVLLIGLILISCLVKTGSAQQIRTKQNINREWRFTLGYPDDNPYQSDYNDAKWQRIGLPHSFSIPYFRSPNFYTGYGWYRKIFQIEDDWLDGLAPY